MMREYSVSTDKLSPECKSYLQHINQTGIVPMGLLFMGNGISSWFGLCIGIVFTTVAFYINDVMLAPNVQWWVIIVGTTGLLVLVLSVHSMWVRKKSKNYVGDFEGIDECYWWNVNPHSVGILALEGVMEVDGYHKLKDGNYNGSIIVLKAGQVEVKRSISNKEQAEMIIRYLQEKLSLGLIRAGSFSEVSSTNDHRTRLSALTIVIGLIIGYFLVPYLSLLEKEHELYIGAINGSQSGVELTDKYLEAFPDKFRANEILQFRDNRLFSIAKDTLSTKNLIYGVREYLADKRNNLHRTEAQQEIDDYYVKAVSRLKQMESDKSGESRALFHVFVALLDSLKNRNSPDIYVGFESHNIKQPQNQEDKEFELLVYVSHLTKTPKLREIERQSLTHSAILPLGDAFSASNIARRENIILDRLTESVGKILNGDVITLKKCTANSSDSERKPCHLIIKYVTHPSKSLYLYTQNQNISGLLRGFEIDWKIETRVSEVQPSQVVNLKSQPLSQLRMTGTNSDPQWAPYAVMFYSAFYEFSNKLTLGFGLGAAKPPNSFSFEDATGYIDSAVNHEKLLKTLAPSP
ncbi:MAG: hypothetical protein RIR79_527 [Pseudomonadota bacterium]|jgi:hypothetical protein